MSAEDEIHNPVCGWSENDVRNLISQLIVMEGVQIEGVPIFQVFSQSLHVYWSTCLLSTFVVLHTLQIPKIAEYNVIQSNEFKQNMK